MGVPAVTTPVDRDEARSLLGLGNKRVVTLFGFLSAKKGHIESIDAMLRLPDNVMLLLAGGKHPNDHTDYVERITKLIEQKNLSQRVRITGYLPPTDMLNVMAATDVAIAPYSRSSGSASVGQLMAAGLPIVATRIPAFEEINRQAAGTLLLMEQNPTAELLGCEILSVLSRPDQLQALRTSARKYASANTYRNMAEATVEVYKAALA
jgi:glycosyltransferase involved in cell wall biosynthesis